MPRRDGTGPMGQGAMSGRGFGFCTRANFAGYGNGYGRGYGYGYGIGLGIGRYGYSCKRIIGGNFTEQFLGMTDKEILSEQKEFLQRRLESIEKQLQNISETDK